MNADGSVTLADGSHLGGPPAGYHRDPNTGLIVADNYNPATGAVTGALPGTAGPGGLSGDYSRFLEGFDPTKLADLSHNSIKYRAARVFQHFAPTLGNMPAVIEELKKAGLNVTWKGGDLIDFNDGFGPIDVMRNSSGPGSSGWQWLNPRDVAGGGGGGGGAGAAGGGNYIGASLAAGWKPGDLYPLTATGGDLMQPWDIPFVAPTEITERNDPGFRARFELGMDALQKSAAARGGLFNGETLKNLTQFGQDYASSEYGNVYGRALGEYQQAYNIFEGNQGKQFNRLASLAGLGQTAAGQLGGYGSNYAGIGAGLIGGAGAAYANYLTQAANARAAGGVGGANAWMTALGNIGNDVSGLFARAYGSQYGGH